MAKAIIRCYKCGKESKVSMKENTPCPKCGSYDYTVKQHLQTHTKDTPFETVNIGWSEADEDVWMEICDKDPSIGTTYAFAYIEDNPDCADLNEDTEAEY